MRVWWLVAAIGCGRALPPRPSTNASIEVGTQAIETPSHAAFSTVPADLIDDGTLARIRHHTRVRWLHRASPIHGEPIDPVIARSPSAEIDRVMPVIGESATEIRVAVEDDDARMALWIDRADTWTTLLVPIQIADREGRVAKHTGAWFAKGAAIDVAFGKDRVRHVTLRDPDVAVEGWVPSSVLGNVWLDDAAPPTKRARDPRPQTKFVERATLRAGPDAASPIVAVVLSSNVRGFVIARGAWSELEIVRPHARLRGFVRETELRPDDDELGAIGTTGGHGFGMSHASRIAIPAGTCLFDKPTGNVIGVQIKESVRYGERDIDVDGWSRVYVDSPWAVLGFFVHDTGSDPKQPVWESCGHR